MSQNFKKPKWYEFFYFTDSGRDVQYNLSQTGLIWRERINPPHLKCRRDTNLKKITV